MLLALVLPLLVSYLGTALLSSPQRQGSKTITSSISAEEDSLKAFQMAAGETTIPAEQNKGFGFRELSLFVALLAGLVALLWWYLKNSLVWVAVIVIPLIFSFWAVRLLGLSLILFYLPSLAFAVLLAVLIRYLFFHPSILRFRMVLCSILGAGLLALYYRSFFLLTRQVFLPGYWSEVLMSSLILMIFTTFGLSMADLIIVRGEVAQLRAEERRRALADEENPDQHAH